jgi:hypothetical protein
MSVLSKGKIQTKGKWDFILTTRLYTTQDGHGTIGAVRGQENRVSAVSPGLARVTSFFGYMNE